MRVLVAGASGFVGRRLCPVLQAAGHDVVAMTRNPDRYQGAGTPVLGDVQDGASLAVAMSGCEAACYLVHSLGSAAFERKDSLGAAMFAMSARAVGLARIVYLGGLGSDSDKLSAHLRSRRDVERQLGSTGVPLTVLRAGIIVGHGGLSWEMTRQLVEHLRVMVTPKWVATRTQPIAVDDVVQYLANVLVLAPAANKVFEVGGPEVLQYRTILERVAAIERRRLTIVPVPLLSPGLSSLWLNLITDVDITSARTLVNSMTTEMVVRDPSIRCLVPFEPTPFNTAVRTALAERRTAGTAHSYPSRRWAAWPGRRCHRRR